jgi:hypothetical protein
MRGRSHRTWQWDCAEQQFIWENLWDTLESGKINDPEIQVFTSLRERISSECEAFGIIYVKGGTFYKSYVIDKSCIGETILLIRCTGAICPRSHRPLQSDRNHYMFSAWISFSWIIHSKDQPKDIQMVRCHYPPISRRRISRDEPLEAQIRRNEFQYGKVWNRAGKSIVQRCQWNNISCNCQSLANCFFVVNHRIWFSHD